MTRRGTAAEQLQLAPELGPGRREKALEARRRYHSAPTVTAADREHARHADQCKICQDGDRCHQAVRDELDRVEAARVIYVQGLHDVLDQTEGVIRKKLALLQAAADRAWRTDRRTADLQHRADPAAETRRRAEHSVFLAALARAQAELDRLAAVQIRDGEVVCQACGLILIGLRPRGPIVALYREAAEHAVRCKGTPETP